MVDQERVCCMCGDVGFPDKIFQCSRCCFRLQHSYCSNYYYGDESSTTTTTTTLCDWCLSEGRNSSSSTNTRHLIKIKPSSLSSSSIDVHEHNQRLNKPYENNQQHQTANNVESPRERGTTNVARNSGIPSPRTGTHRRYKLLKDVMC